MTHKSPGAIDSIDYFQAIAKSATPAVARKFTLLGLSAKERDQVTQLEQIESRLWSILEAIEGPQPPSVDCADSGEVEDVCIGLVDQIGCTQAEIKASISRINDLISKIDTVIR